MRGEQRSQFLVRRVELVPQVGRELSRIWREEAMIAQSALVVEHLGHGQVAAPDDALKRKSSERAIDDRGTEANAAVSQLLQGHPGVVAERSGVGGVEECVGG